MGFAGLGFGHPRSRWPKLGLSHTVTHQKHRRGNFTTQTRSTQRFTRHTRHQGCHVVVAVVLTIRYTNSHNVQEREGEPTEGDPGSTAGQFLINPKRHGSNQPRITGNGTINGNHQHSTGVSNTIEYPMEMRRLESHPSRPQDAILLMVQTISHRRLSREHKRHCNMARTTPHATLEGVRNTSSMKCHHAGLNEDTACNGFIAFSHYRSLATTSAATPTVNVSHERHACMGRIDFCEHLLCNIYLGCLLIGYMADTSGSDRVASETSPAVLVYSDLISILEGFGADPNGYGARAQLATTLHVGKCVYMCQSASLNGDTAHNSFFDFFLYKNIATTIVATPGVQSSTRELCWHGP